MEQHFDDTRRDTERTRTELERRLNEMNQFRAQIDQERTGYMRKDDYELRHQLLVSRIELTEKWQSRWMGITAAVVVITGFVASTLGLIWGWASKSPKP